jgi:hypothetical protein
MSNLEKCEQLYLDYTKAVRELQEIQEMEDKKKVEIRQIIQKVRYLDK